MIYIIVKMQRGPKYIDTLQESPSSRMCKASRPKLKAGVAPGFLVEIRKKSFNRVKIMDSRH